MNDFFNLHNKVAIVTGGNGGLGKAIARGLASVGADIVIAARNEAKTVAAVSEIHEESDGQVVGITVDVKQANQIRDLAAKTLEVFGHIDILVNNAGINIRKLPQDYKASEWDEVIDINLRGAFLCSQAVYPAMRTAGGGKIINIGSMLSIFGGANLAPYGTSKGGIVQLTKSLSVAWAPDNIQVNAILPGYINTDLTGRAKKEMPGFEEYVLGRSPTGRWGEPEDLSGTAIFLASRAADFVTGVALPVDGGFSVMV
ncbi:SDR family NAD(P)-dependent oxidoreductase [Chloroflexota bacterium]